MSLPDSAPNVFNAFEQTDEGIGDMAYREGNVLMVTENPRVKSCPFFY